MCTGLCGAHPSTARPPSPVFLHTHVCTVKLAPSSPPEWTRHPIPLHTHTSVHRPVAAPVLRGDLRAQAGGAQRGLAAKAPVQRRRLLGLAQQHLRGGTHQGQAGPGLQGPREPRAEPSPAAPWSRSAAGAGRGVRAPGSEAAGGGARSSPPKSVWPGLGREGAGPPPNGRGPLPEGRGLGSKVPGGGGGGGPRGRRGCFGARGHPAGKSRDFEEKCRPFRGALGW